ncbi:MAG: serine/threonine-protein phosphatase [Planctomycetota bacterium]|nr:serine/threonine-protein phosphatase [Planctomycetota bacterium]
MDWDDVLIDAAATDTGMRRSNNQDSHSLVRASNPEAWRQRGHLFMVADGMGAHAVGELASKLACDNIPHNYNKLKTGNPAESLTKAYREVGALIHGRASANLDFQGMGTTCTTLLLLPEGALIAHVGDSRAYRIRRDRIDQLTFDHSLVWELIRHNHLKPDDKSVRVPKNVITRSLGPEPTVEVDIEGPLAIESGDVYTLCSDGLSGLVSDPEIGAFAGHFHPKDAARYLVHLANLRGGFDNITVVIVRIGAWVEPDSAEVRTMAERESSVPGGGVKVRLKDAFTRLLTRRKPSAVVVEEHLYRSADCPITAALVESLDELTRRVQAAAVEQSWSIDWTNLATLRRLEAEALQAGNHRKALYQIGELIAMLGQAARYYKKGGGNGHS